MVDIERVKLPLDENKFNYLHDALIEWYVSAKPGDWFTYYQGWGLHENLATERVRQTAWDFACDGKVYLFLKRDPVDTRLFLFMCQKSTKPTFRLVPKRRVEDK